MKKILICLILGMFLFSTLIGTSLIKDKIKIKDINEIDYNKKYDENCSEKIKIKDEYGIKINLVKDGENGTEFYEIYNIQNE